MTLLSTDARPAAAQVLGTRDWPNLILVVRSIILLGREKDSVRTLLQHLRRPLPRSGSLRVRFFGARLFHVR